MAKVKPATQSINYRPGVNVTQDGRAEQRNHAISEATKATTGTDIAIGDAAKAALTKAPSK